MREPQRWSSAERYRSLLLRERAETDRKHVLKILAKGKIKNPPLAKPRRRAATDRKALADG